MLTVTAAAAQHLLDIKDQSGVNGPLRLVVEDSQLALRVEAEQIGDQPIDRDGTTVLFVSQEVSTALDGSTIDAQEGENGPRLTLMPADAGA